MFGLSLRESLDVAQTLALVVGGIWGLFLFRTTRRGEAKVAIEASPGLKRNFVRGKSLLIVRLKIANASNVLWRHESSVVTLFDARKLTSDNNLRLVPFAQTDPFLPVYGVEQEEAAAIAEGRTFSYFEGQEISLEPGEQVLSDVAFAIDESEIGLMGLKIWVRGRQRRWRQAPYEWATFLLVDPDDVRPDRTREQAPVSSTIEES